MVTTTSMLTTNRHVGRQGKKPRLIVIHTMEAPEGPQTAENVARYFLGAKASAHWCIDNNSRVRSVKDADTAWTAPGANNDGLQIELAGYARQSAKDWADAFSRAELEIAALSAAEWVNKYKIPVRKLSAAQVLNGSYGFCGHVDVTNAYRKSTHTDPGTNFPWDYFLDRVDAYARGGTVSPAPTAAEQLKPTPVLRNADGSIQLGIDGVRGPATIARWQEVMGTPIDGQISKQSKLIMADQEFLNSVVAEEHMRNLTGYDKLSVDGDEGSRTIAARQFWLRNAMNSVHQKNLIGHQLEFDGVLGPETNKVHQFALNNTNSGSKTYGRV